MCHGKIGSEGHSEWGAAMLIHLHRQATTTSKVRAVIQASDDAGTVLAEHFGATPQTIYKWRRRKPELFKKQPYHPPECDSFCGVNLVYFTNPSANR